MFSVQKGSVFLTVPDVDFVAAKQEVQKTNNGSSKRAIKKKKENCRQVFLLTRHSPKLGK